VNETYDVAIAGGGPAGLSAAIWMSRYLHSVVLVDSGDPRNWETRGVNGFLGLPGIRPSELRANGRDEARKYGAVLIDDTVDTVAQADEGFALTLRSGERYASRRLLLAIGLKDVWPDIPGLARVYGATAHICPDCDGYETRGKKTVVLGNGRRAAGMALNLTTWTRDLIICTNGEAPDLNLPEYCQKLDALNIPVLTDRVKQVCTEQGQLHCLKLENGMDLDVEKIFIATEQYPADDLGAQLGCKRDAGGHIVVDPHYHTSVFNVFAAGDIVPGSQLAIAAAADGAIAALSIHKSLVPDGRKLAPMGKAVEKRA
jgi:thioredoxin reductase (NADPH)